MSDSYFTLDEDWRFSQVNASLAHFLGKTGRDLLGASFRDEATDSVPRSRAYQRQISR